MLATGVGRRYLIELEAGKPTARLGPALMIARQLGIGFGPVDQGEDGQPYRDAPGPPPPPDLPLAKN